MSKTLAATCSAGIVTVDGVPVPSASIGSEGVGSSEGVLILDEDAAHYIPKTSGDLKTTLDKLVAALAQLKTALDKTVEALGKSAAAATQLDSKPTGGTGSAVVPVAAANITGITTASSGITTAANQIDLIRGQLDTLKGGLA